MNPLIELRKAGQSIWLDYIRRSLITSGELARIIDEDGVSGVTINPTIFEKAIAGSSDYDDHLRTLLKKDPHMTRRQLYESLAVTDVQKTADALRPIYDSTDGADGYVSLELSPSLATDTAGSIEEARYFWKLVNRPNLMIKVPATPEGTAVIETLISEGVNVNVTLMFSLTHYEAVAEAYLQGLEACSDPSKVASVASFFVSRVDTAVDGALEKNGSDLALRLRGKIAVANSKLAYKRFKEVFSGSRWEKFSGRGGMVQRVLWASTGTKNPTYSDVVYVEELIGADTVNTMPPATMKAFADHGRVRSSLEEEVEKAGKEVDALNELGISLDMITEALQKEGLKKFSESYDKLIAALEEKKTRLLHGSTERMVLNLGEVERAVDRRIKNWEKQEFNRRLWDKDPTLWFSQPTEEITNRLGWLNLPEIMHEQLDSLTAFAKEIKEEGIKDVVLLGMGGSSLAPEVFARTFGSAPGYPRLSVLDSTHPDAVQAVSERIDLDSTLFIVASKSGTTLEPNLFFTYFWSKIKDVAADPGRHFIAITDSGTPLEALGRNHGFRRVFHAHSDLGGRYSALTVFGLLPAALIGADIHRLLDRAWVAAEGCAFCVSVGKTPGLMLGAALGELALSGRGKATFLASKEISSFPSWLEQLIAESTGKIGRGILPVASEPLTNTYGSDRFFVYFRLDGDDNQELDQTIKSIENAGHPSITIRLEDKYDIGMEIFRWEVAVAAAGTILGIHPFNQPDVEHSKELAREAMEQKNGGDGKSRDMISVSDLPALDKAIKHWIGQAKPGDYFGIDAYLKPSRETWTQLQSMRKEILTKTCLATTLGYGPRFLHSTGQLHKGGPNTGLFLQLLSEPEQDVPVPGDPHTFNDVIRAQSLGDYRALLSRGRRVIRINLGRDVTAGIQTITEKIKEARL